MATEEGYSVGLPVADFSDVTNAVISKGEEKLPVNGFNQLTGFIEIYPSGTTFSNSKPYSPLSNNLLYSDGTGEEIGANESSNEPLLTASFLNKVEIKSSFRTLTDTCDIVIPRIEELILDDKRGVNNYSVIDPNTFDDSPIFSQGNICRVYLGYDYQDKLMFHGYITEVVTKSPITLKLEDAMYLLKRKVISKTYKPVGDNKEVRLEDFIHDILEGTGVELDQSTIDIAPDITFGAYFRAKQSSVARIMGDIQNRGLSVFVEDGKLVIGRTYFDSSLTPHVSTKSSPDYIPPVINMEWNVPSGGNKLLVISPDKRRKMITVVAFLGVRASRQIQLNVALDPNQKDDVFVGVQISDSSNKNDVDQELALNNWVADKYETSVDTEGYSQHTANMGIINVTNKGMTSDDAEFSEVVDKMFLHGQDKFMQFFDNGLGGEVTIFGDYGLKSAQSVETFDPRNPEISGEFLITECATSWGFSGYRQTLKIGTKIRDIDRRVDDILSDDPFYSSSQQETVV